MIITIINQKGGTGKTTTTVNLGRALTKNGYKVMLVDFDPQGNLSYSLGINEIEFAVSDALINGVELKKMIVKREEMDVVPTDQRLSVMEFNTTDKSRESLLKTALAQASGYDFVLIDCPPSLSILTINALNASDRVLIPIQLDVFSLQGLQQIMATIAEVKREFNPDLKILGVLPVLVDNRKKLTSEIKEHLRENFEVHVFKNEVRTNVKAAEAPSFGQSVIEYAPESNSAQDYLAAASELIKISLN